MSEGHGLLDLEAEEADGKPPACNMEVLDEFLGTYKRLDNIGSEIDATYVDVGLDLDIEGVWAGEDANELCSAAAKNSSAGHSSGAELLARTAPPLSNFRKDVGVSVGYERLVDSPPATAHEDDNGCRRPREGEEARGGHTRFVNILPASPYQGDIASTYQPLPKPKRGPYRDNWPKESTTQTPYPGHPFGWGSTIHPTMRQNQQQESFKERWVTVSAHYGEAEGEGELEHKGT